MKVLLVTSEAAPFAKTGGLGDVAAALPSALRKRRVSVRVMMPLYGVIADQWREQMKFLRYIYVTLGWRQLYCGLFELEKDGVTYYFLDNEYYFKRNDIYGHFDDMERFAFFSRAVSELIPALDGWTPQVVHCNDWQTALVPVYMRKIYGGDPRYDGIRVLFTIHNVEYQGRGGADLLENVFGLPMELFFHGTMEYMGGINLMKGAIELSDWVTTVSPTYARELRHAFCAHGMEGVLSAARGKFSGILNGIDAELFDPATGASLVKNYTAADQSGKAVCKAELQKLLGLEQNPDVMLVVIVSRLVSHKGMDLVAAALDELMSLDVQAALIGRGDWHFEQFFSDAARRYPHRFSASIVYSPSLAQSLYGGGDLLLMPSQSEPCGLTQMIAMRYGTVPAVRETGGLKDTVTPFNPDTGQGMGFTFANYNGGDMVDAVRRALDVYQNRRGDWNRMIRENMARDFSWKDSASAYERLYKQLTSR